MLELVFIRDPGKPLVDEFPEVFFLKYNPDA